MTKRIREDDDDSSNHRVVLPTVSLSRQVKSCESCKQLKIKCHLSQTGPPCKECVHRSKPCRTSQSIHEWIEQETIWKEKISTDIVRLESTLQKLLADGRLLFSNEPSPTNTFSNINEDGSRNGANDNNNNYQLNSNKNSRSSSPQDEIHNENSSQISPCSALGEGGISPNQIRRGGQNSNNSNNNISQGASSPLNNSTTTNEPRIVSEEKAKQQLPSVPGKYLFEVTKDPSFGDIFVQNSDPRSEVSNDLISKGLISLEQGKLLFSKFKNLDQYIYGVTVMHESLESVRTSSCMLTACICAVAALHDPELDILCQIAEAEFLRLLSQKMFTRTFSLDDSRAICIGTFWLHNVCFALSNFAVPFSADLYVEQSLDVVLKKEAPVNIQNMCYLRVRLWYLLFICDHQFSIPYGRPPAIRQNIATRNWEKFAECDVAQEEDLRIVSQVHLWSIMDRVSDEFGANACLAISKEQYPRVHVYLVELDMYRIRWGTKFRKNSLIGSYPEKGCIMHHHFAKLFVCLIPLRGQLSGSQALGPALYEFGNQAVLSAQGIVKLFVADIETHSMLIGLPLYFHTMIAFASIFLIKVTTLFELQFDTDREGIFALVGSLVEILEKQSQFASKYHIISNMASGLRRILDHCRQETKAETYNNGNGDISHLHNENNKIINNDNNDNDNNDNNDTNDIDINSNININSSNNHINLMSSGTVSGLAAVAGNTSPNSASANNTATHTPYSNNNHDKIHHQSTERMWSQLAQELNHETTVSALSDGSKWFGQPFLLTDFDLLPLPGTDDGQLYTVNSWSSPQVSSAVSSSQWKPT